MGSHPSFKLAAEILGAVQFHEASALRKNCKQSGQLRIKMLTPHNEKAWLLSTVLPARGPQMSECNSLAR